MAVELPATKQPNMPPVRETSPEKPVEEISKEDSAKMVKAMDRAHDKTYAYRKPKAEKAETTKEKVKDDEKPAKPAEAKDEKPKEDEAAKAKEEADKKAADEAKEKAAKAKKTLKPKQEAKKPDVDLEKLVSSTVAATAKAVREASPEVKADDVPASRREEYAAIKQAEKDGLARKGAAEDARAAFKAEQEYVARWKRDHPNEKFDAESGEHDKFYEDNVPDWIEDATEKGRESIQKETVLEEARKEAKKELEPLQQKLSAAELREEQRAIQQSSQEQVRVGIGLAVAAINPELIKDNVKIEEVDPLAHEILMRVGPEIAHVTQEALMLFATEGRSFQSHETNKPEEIARHVLHTRILNTAESLESDLAGRTEEELTQPDGKVFATRAQWNAMSAAERENHWIVTGELVALKLANDAAEKAKTIYDAEQKRIERLTKRPAAVAAPPVKATNGAAEHKTEKAEEDNDDAAKPRSPSTAADTAIRPGVAVNANTAQDGGSRMFSKMFGKA